MSDDLATRHANAIRILREWRSIWKREPPEQRKSSTWVIHEICRLEREADAALAAEPAQSSPPPACVVCGYTEVTHGRNIYACGAFRLEK